MYGVSKGQMYGKKDKCIAMSFLKRYTYCRKSKRTKVRWYYGKRKEK